MAINLQKGQTIDLRKNDKGESFDLSKVTIGLGWDVKQKEGSFLGKLFGTNKEEEFDLDVIAFLLDSNGKVANLGKELVFSNGQKVGLHGGDVVFFNSMTFPSGTGTSNMLFPEGTPKHTIQQKINQLLSNGELMVHTGDNLTGEGDGDDEQIIIKLESLPARIEKIVFLVCIYQGIQKNQQFGKVENAFIRACDSNNKEIAKYTLSNSPELENKHSLVFGETYRHNNGWKFRAIGEPLHTDNFVDVLKKYIN
ncbi:stress response protein SCP2 [Flavobacterium sp. 28A]|uniref:TerD family protein n=1 Tax=Flavobacterium sp. 28A TaxID=2735895 RepID=UPI0015713CC6|nr:TerD family protein [Flavobacterium sp. 28A]NRT16998.1 stress response protein SCP2 [Flavobacterium sp. 28A]